MVNNEGLFVYPLCKNDFLPPKLILVQVKVAQKEIKRIQKPLDFIFLIFQMWTIYYFGRL